MTKVVSTISAWPKPNPKCLHMLQNSVHNGGTQLLISHVKLYSIQYSFHLSIYGKSKKKIKSMKMKKEEIIQRRLLPRLAKIQQYYPKQTVLLYIQTKTKFVQIQTLNGLVQVPAMMKWRSGSPVEPVFLSVVDLNSPGKGPFMSDVIYECSLIR